MQSGVLLVYQLWLGELRGVVPTLPSISQHSTQAQSQVLAGGCAVDPSGLYVAVATAAVEWRASSAPAPTVDASAHGVRIVGTAAAPGAATSAGLQPTFAGAGTGREARHSPAPLSRVAVYEVMTGRYVCGLSGLPHVCSLAWAPVPRPSRGAVWHYNDANAAGKTPARAAVEGTTLRLAVGCYDGTLAVLRAPQHMHKNVADAVAVGALTHDVSVYSTLL